MNSDGPRQEKPAIDTELVTAGRDPHAHSGLVNVPVYHGSTILFRDTDALFDPNKPFVYGRRGTPTSKALEDAITGLEGGYGTKVLPSGLAAITTAILAVVSAGDHVLMTDAVYRPARTCADTLLKRLGIETTYYDPTIGAGIADMIRDNTKLIYMESPGSQTMEVQDVPAIVAVARDRGVLTAFDNTWATIVNFKPLAMGVDISIQAATKYLGGHSDIMMGAVTVTEPLWDALHETYENLGQCTGPDDIFLALRGLRTLGLRMVRHEASAIAVAHWLKQRPEIARVMYPALPEDPGHAIWARDFSGSSGLFSVLFEGQTEKSVYAFLDALTYFGMGFSWGGYESLAVPFDVTSHRVATDWSQDAPGVRFHIGLEDVADLTADLERGFEAMAAAG